MLRNLLILLVLFVVPLSTFAYKDDYVWQEKFRSQLPAAKSGDSDAQYDVGAMYEKGNGVARDEVKAFEWYLKSAEQGNDKAAYKVGFMYLRGKGVKRNYKQAFKWLNTSADQNNVRAYYYLGTMYEKGNGVSKNLQTAVNWYTRAQKGGFTLAVERVESLKKVMDQNEARQAAEIQRNVARQQKVALKKSKPKRTGKRNTKDELLAGGWTKRNIPAEYLPSKNTQCKDKGSTIECNSSEVTRNIGMADIKYTTKAVLYGMKRNGEFKISYRNNVVDIQVTDKNFIDSGGTLPVRLGWQDAEHKLECNIQGKNEVNCTKNKLRKIMFTRK